MRDPAPTPHPVQHLVREVLGCTCPDEIFSQIEFGSVPASNRRAEIKRIAVGGRLLIYLVDLKRTQQAADELEELVRKGKAERDLLRMNRFRLVIAAYDTGPDANCLMRLFERISGVDEKTHLHVVDRSVLAGL